MQYRLLKLISITITLLFISANITTTAPALAGPLYYSRETGPYNASCGKWGWFFNDTWSFNLPVEGYKGRTVDYVNGLETAVLDWAVPVAPTPGAYSGVLTYNEGHPLTDDHGYYLGFPMPLDYTAKAVMTYYTVGDHRLIGTTAYVISCNSGQATVSIYNY